jgi:predicted nucleotidyltransferase
MGLEKALNRYFPTQTDVLCVYLFGSVARGKERRGSDLDIAVLFDSGVPTEQHTQRQLALMDDLSRLVDRDVDVVVLNKASCFMRFQILRSGRRLYERSNRREHEFESRAIREYFDFLPVRRRLEETLVSRVRRASAW